MKKIFNVVLLLILLILNSCNNSISSSNNSISSSNKSNSSFNPNLDYSFDKDLHFVINKDGSHSYEGAHSFNNGFCSICDAHESIKEMNFELISYADGYSIEKNDNQNLKGNVYIPREYNGLPVVRIGEQSFTGSHLNIYVPDTIRIVLALGFYTGNTNIFLEHKSLPEYFMEHWNNKSNYYLGYVEGKYQIELYSDTLDYKIGVYANFGETLISAPVPLKDGYLFMGYYDQKDGGTKYYNEKMECVKSWDKNENGILYPHWESEIYTIIFDPNGGDGSMEPFVFTYEQVKNGLNFPENTFTNGDLIFCGWKYDKNSSIMYGDTEGGLEKIFTYLYPNHGDTIKLYATWIQGIDIIFDFFYADDKVLVNSEYNVFNNVTVETSNGVDLFPYTSVSSNCALDHRTLDTSEVKTCKIDYSASYEYKGFTFTETATRYVEVVSSIEENHNLLINGDFMSNLEHWGFEEEEGNGSYISTERVEINGKLKNAARIFLKNSDSTGESTPRLISSYYKTDYELKGFTLEKGKNYQISFKAKAEAAKYISVEIGRFFSTSPWYEPFTTEEQKYYVEIGEEWNEYYYEFTATHNTLTNCSIIFNLGKHPQAKEARTTLWLTDIYIGEYNGVIEDKIAPKILGLEYTILETSLTPYNVFEEVSAYDNPDGDLSSSIIAKYNGIQVTTIDISRPCDYTINYEVVDSAGNKTTGSKRIVVINSSQNLLSGINAERLIKDSYAIPGIMQNIFDFSNGFISVQTVGVGINSYDNQININNIPCEKNKSYLLSFEIATATTFTLKFVQNQEPYAKYAEVEVLKSEHFDFDNCEVVTMIIDAADFDPINKLTIELGTVGFEAAFYIKNITLCPIE